VSQNLDFIRALYENDQLFALAKGGEAPMEGFYQPDAVLDLRLFPIPGLQPVYRGVEEIRRFWMEWFEPWDEMSWTAEFHERGEDVLAVVEMSGRGAASEVVAELPRHAQLFRFRAGLVELHRMFPDAVDGFAEAGIEFPSG
jgi:hypothetical protein